MFADINFVLSNLSKTIKEAGGFGGWIAGLRAGQTPRNTPTAQPLGNADFNGTSKLRKRTETLLAAHNTLNPNAPIEPVGKNTLLGM